MYNYTIFNTKVILFKHSPKINPLRLKGFQENRKYSTFSSSRSQLNHNSFSNNSGNIKPIFGVLNNLNKVKLPCVIKCKLRNMSIYNKNYEVSKILLELIHSNDTKENIQRKIEIYLITKQNNLLISNDNSKFNLINTKLAQLLFDSKVYLEKLYLNYIELKNPKEEKQVLVNVLLTVGFEYISNILFGRLLSIISNNQRTNSNTIFTNVAHDLGKDLVNRYNYIMYSNNSSNYQSFSLFKTENPNKIIQTEDDITFFVELGSILLGWLIELKLIQTKIVVLSKDEKRNTLVLADKLNKVISQEKIDTKLLNLPVKIPMITKPKKYVLH